MNKILLGLALITGQAWAIVPCSTDTDCSIKNQSLEQSEYPTCESLPSDTKSEVMCEREDGIELEYTEFKNGDE